MGWWGRGWCWWWYGGGFLKWRICNTIGFNTKTV
jgi:hypothetical protein